jgi:hypothetical protein
MSYVHEPHTHEVENMAFKMVVMATLAILMVVFYPLEGVPAERDPVTPSREWSGSVDDSALLNAAPEIILSAKEFETVWLAWKLPGPVPEVDFSSNLAAVQTTQGSRLRLSAMLEDNGNLKVLGLATRDLHPGFRYVLSVLSRKGVKTVNGKELPNKAGKAHIEPGSTPDRADFGVPVDIEVKSVKAIDPKKVNDEIGQAYRKGEAWPKKAVLVALTFVGAGLKGNAKTIEVSTPPETRETATITVTESGYLDDSIAGERWKLWMTKKADGPWVIRRVLWAQLCSRPGHRFYSAERCP